MGLAVAVLLVVAALVLSGGSAEHTDPDVGERSTYVGVEELSVALGDAGFACRMHRLADEVRELGRCAVGREEAVLSVWHDPGVMRLLVDPGGGPAPESIAYGNNWTIEVEEEATARAMADALHGTVGSG
jgi:hypothetical protein